MTRSAQWHDVHSRFARAHLRTREERGVYFTLVAQLAPSWSATEIARLKHLDTDAVAAILAGYERAGIVEVLDAPTGRRYRWRSDMSYLYGADPNTMNRVCPDRVDPVCGMRVDEQTPYRTRDTSGRMRLFCSATCASIFQKTLATSDGPEATGSRPAGGSPRRGAMLTLLYVEGCPGFPLVAQGLRAALANIGADGLLVRARPIREAAPAADGFAGSPTLLINGVDPFPTLEPTTALGCRHYRTDAGLDAAPSVEQLVTALRTHLAA